MDKGGSNAWLNVETICGEPASSKCTARSQIDRSLAFRYDNAAVIVITKSIVALILAGREARQK